MRRVLGAFCLCAVLLSGAAHAAAPQTCDFDDAVYANITNPDIAFWSEPYSRSVIPDEWTRFPTVPGTKLRKFFTELRENWEDGRVIKRSYFLIDPMGDKPHIWRTYDEFSTQLVPYFLFDEKLRWIDPKHVKTAPAYFFMPGMADIPTAFFRLRNCQIPDVPMPVLRPDDVITSRDCPVERAVFQNMKDPSISLWFEPTTERSFSGLAMVVQSEKTPKRAYLMEMQNGTGLPILYGTTDDDTDSAGLLYSYDAIGRPSGKDPSTRFVFPTEMPDDVPYALFQLKECKPEAATSKPAQ